jgi:cytochrome P450
MRQGSARWHERRVLAGANRALPILLGAGRLASPIRRVPRLGWVVADPVTARRILNDHAHFTLLGEGGVGHLWAQVLGDWVNDVFDGPGHHALRTRTRELFTDENAQALVVRVAGLRLDAARRDLEDGKTVDVADLARVIVGRMVTDLLGLDPAADADADAADADEPYRQVFATGEELAALALGTTTSTVLEEATVVRAKAIVARLTRNVAEAYHSAPAERLLGRCRELGVEPRHAEGLATLLMVAGTETAASAMARTVALLHDTGEQDRLRAEPERLADAVREGLRVTTPAPLIGRSVSADVSVAGRRLRRGERVMMLTWTANNAPGGFALDRPYLPDNRQLWFGAGRHLCLGAPVARAEIGALLRAIIATGRRYRVVERAVRRRVLIPSYERLRIQLA